MEVVVALITDGHVADFSLLPVADVPEAWDEIRDLGSYETLAGGTRDIHPGIFDFAVSRDRRGLGLRSLILKKEFQGLLSRTFKRTTKLYFVSWAWDLSGRAVAWYPGEQSDPDNAAILPIRTGEEWRFIGEGVSLFPARRVTGGLGIRLQLWESHRGGRNFGNTMTEVGAAIQDSNFSRLLETISIATGLGPVTLTGIEAAVQMLSEAIGAVLRGRDDQVVDYYEGNFPVSLPWPKTDLTYGHASSEIVLSRFA
jgi:hypothetical protein